MTGHEEFLELCALSTSGALNTEEQQRLEAHLAACGECREALRQYEAVVDIGMPKFASELSADAESQEVDQVWSEQAAEARFVERLALEKMGERQLSGKPKDGILKLRATRVHDLLIWSAAAVILLSLLGGTLVYKVAFRRLTPKTVLITHNATATNPADVQQQLATLARERDIANEQLKQRDEALSLLKRKIGEEMATVEKLKDKQLDLENTLKSSEESKQQLQLERESVARKYEAAQASREKMQRDLGSLQERRSEDVTQAASMEAKVTELTRLLNERDGTIDEQTQLLAHDRDIRELMGARDLYIAEVYDVDRNGKTRKPYGRVFFTKGKSLVFYAYDLDRQPGVRNASSFQAWGRSGPNRKQALSLGIFYEDSSANKRWILKSDNAKTLEQIDAVFVTIEPRGGSQSPSGKPLLFAYLRVEPNHP